MNWDIPCIYIYAYTIYQPLRNGIIYYMGTSGVGLLTTCDSWDGPPRPANSARCQVFLITQPGAKLKGEEGLLTLLT